MVTGGVMKEENKNEYYKKLHKKISNELEINTGAVIKLRNALLGESISKITLLKRAYETAESIQEQINRLKYSLSTWRQVITFIDTATNKEWEILLQEEEEVL